MKRFTVIAMGALTALALTLPANGAAPAASAASGKFTLFGTAEKAKDPTGVKPVNHVIRVDTTDVDGSGLAPVFEFGAAQRSLNVQAEDLDGLISLRYFLVDRDCVGGPRIQLAVDADGDGDFQQGAGSPDGHMFGYIGDQPFGGVCDDNLWVSEDMTNAQAKWDLGQLGGNQSMSWDSAENYVHTTYVDHSVHTGSLVDDSSWCYPPICATDGEGIVYFDDVQIGNRTLSGPSDTIG